MGRLIERIRFEPARFVLAGFDGLSCRAAAYAEIKVAITVVTEATTEKEVNSQSKK